MLDTTPEAAAAQAAVYRRMSGEEKVRIALEMTETVRHLAMTRIAEQHPGFTPAQIREQLIWELYGVRPAHR